MIVNEDTMDVIEFFLPEKYEVLQVTEVGSQMWGMADLSSDHDIVVIYREKTRDILKGKPTHPTLPCNHHKWIHGQEYDFSYLEVGHFCHQLKKGNVNMLWALLSPIVTYQTKEMNHLACYIRNSVHTADIVPSGIGMTESQLADIEKRAAVRSPEKSVKTAYRTIRFVHDHLVTGQWNFRPVERRVLRVSVQSYIDEVRNLIAEKEFDSMPKEWIEQWLLDVRLSDLNL